jgi:AbrB family looped-hinge helix DNA binding protein
MVWMNVRIGKAGRVVIPKAIRDALDLRAGDTLELTTAGEWITLRPAPIAAPLRQEHGVWVYRSGRPLAADIAGDTLRALRHERMVRHGAIDKSKRG